MEQSTLSSVAKFLEYKGFKFPDIYVTPEYLDSLKDFEIRDSDVFIVTYPKSGTVWTQQILSLIYSDGDLDETDSILNALCVPWLEFNTSNMDYVHRPSPRLFATHMPYYLVPKALRTKKGKVIYIARNPKDAMVSYYHFHNALVTLETPKNMDEFMDRYVTGNVICSSWFDHIRGWYTHRDEFNFLYITYEEMIKNLRATVIKLCSFLGKKLSEDTIDEIVKRSTFKNMKSNPNANYEHIPEDIMDKNKGCFLRKGTIGDWKNTLTVTQNEYFDEVFQEKMKDLPLNFIWDINEYASIHH